MTEDESAIRTLIQTWLDATAAGDFATVLTLMSDDVVFMVPGREPFGKDMFAAASAALKDFRIETKSDIREIEIFGDIAYLRNRLEAAMTPPGGGKPMRHAGHTLTILRKIAGKWLVVRDANLMMPTP